MKTLICVSVVLLASSGFAAADMDLYREFRLGSSTATVVTQTGTIARDLKTLHQRPALLQELSWRPPYMFKGVMSGRDSVRGVVFSFMNDQLFKMGVDYDTRQTEGMTQADMIASLIAVYGPVVPLAPPAPRRAGVSAMEMSVPIARWQGGDTQIVLQHSAYAGAFGLVITSVSIEQRARKAQTDAEALDVREAPARDAAQAKARDDAAKKAAEATRTTNKGSFKP